MGAKEGKPATGLMSDWLKKGEIEGMNHRRSSRWGNEMKKRRFVDRRSVSRRGGVKPPAPQRRIHLHDREPPGRNSPAVKRPEVDPLADLPANGTEFRVVASCSFKREDVPRRRYDEILDRLRRFEVETQFFHVSFRIVRSLRIPGARAAVFVLRVCRTHSL